jgi:hypothetical protein
MNEPPTLEPAIGCALPLSSFQLQRDGVTIIMPSDAIPEQSSVWCSIITVGGRT